MIIPGRIVLPAALALWMATAAAQVDDVDRATAFVRDLPTDTLYTDGYQVHATPPVRSVDGQQRMLPVALLSYYQRAWQTFLASDDLAEWQRQPMHYKIGHEIAGDRLTVIIQGLLLPHLVDGQVDGILRVTAGPSLQLHYDLASGSLTGQERLR